MLQNVWPIFLLASILSGPIHADISCSDDSDLQTDIAEIKDLELELQERKQLVRNRKQLMRSKAERLKKDQSEQKKRLRARQKCEKVTRQIESINQRLRTGYTVEQGNILQRKLAEYRAIKRKVCTHE